MRSSIKVSFVRPVYVRRRMVPLKIIIKKLIIHGEWAKFSFFLHKKSVAFLVLPMKDSERGLNMDIFMRYMYTE